LIDKCRKRLPLPLFCLTSLRVYAGSAPLLFVMGKFAFSPPASATEAEIHRKLKNFQGNACITTKRANKDHVPQNTMRIKRGARTRTMRTPNEVRIKRGTPTRTMQPPNAMPMKRGARTGTMRPPSAMLIKHAIKNFAPARTMQQPNAMLIIRAFKTCSSSWTTAMLKAREKKLRAI